MGREHQEGPPYDALAVANRFLDLARRDRVELTPMKLQKLVYFAHGWHLGLLKSPLIDELVQAWEFGPVVATIYHAFKIFGNRTIETKASRYDPVLQKFVEPELRGVGFTDQLIEHVWGSYKSFGAGALSNLSHIPHGPWAQAVDDAKARYGRLPKNVAIDEQKIEQYFGQLAKAQT